MRTPPQWLLPLIVVSQFAGTSLWFAGNAVMPDLLLAWTLDPSIMGWVTSSVQLGFIVGTLLSTALTLSDRIAPKSLFFVCATLGAVFNLLPLVAQGPYILLISRVLTGVCLAGIYPVGMKIAASWYKDGLGRAMGYLVGALVLGTALPHGIRALGAGLPWSMVLVVVSGIAFAGGLSLFILVPKSEAPRARASGFGEIRQIFAQRRFRASVLGYIGHMWELYAFWAVVPLIVAWRLGERAAPAQVSMWSGALIGVGALGCVVGGWCSRKVGSARVAQATLAISGLCALSAPWLLHTHDVIFWPVMTFWSVCVIADSPQFSALTASTAPAQWVGSALTISTCLGFAITIVSIESLFALISYTQLAYALPLLALGPLLGLICMRPLLDRQQ